MTTIQSSDLDFNTIKENLKTYLKRQNEFADYNFEGSGLSNILDVLAYNTHINGLTANFALNESFLSSAQLRPSVVSHAETLGYYPRSRTSSTATVQITIPSTGDLITDIVELPKNTTTFKTSLDDVTYTFRTAEKYIAQNDGNGNFTFKTSAGSDNLLIKEGSLKNKTFVVGDVQDQQIYVIPDKTIDTTTLVVEVFDSPTSSTFKSYTNIDQSVRINNDSTIYILREVPNGFYELTFSDGNVLGQSPVPGNVLRISYLSATGSAPNNATVFTADSQVTVGSTDFDLVVTTLSASSAGSDKETVESIKANAPVAFATQQRLVTAEDYKALISQRYSSVVDDVISWGGNDNVPAIYGCVYVGLKFKDGTTEDVKTSTKNSISSELSDNLGIMSIDTKFADPVETFIETTVNFNFDPDLTGTTLDTTQTNIEKAIQTYFTDNLNAFGKTFRSSEIVTLIDAIDPAILNSSLTTNVQQRLAVNTVTPADGLQLGILRDYSINFPVAIALPDDVEYRITSTNMTVDGQLVFIRNLLNSTKLQLINSSDKAVVKDNIGSYDAASGNISLRGINISAIEGDSIRFTATPADSNTIRPLRNYILKYDGNKSRAIGKLDFQNTAITITSGSTSY